MGADVFKETSTPDSWPRAAGSGDVGGTLDRLVDARVARIRELARVNGMDESTGYGHRERGKE